MDRDFAETVALKALAYVVAQDELRGIFLGSTGTDPAQISGGQIAPELLVGALDFLCMDDAWVIAFCDAEGLAYEVPNAARAGLPGGELPNWT